MKLIGLTGGIGSGKSLVADLFRTLGIPVYESDARAKMLMQEDPDVRRKLTDLFGDEAWLPDGQLNRPGIASKVFGDRTLLEKLNAIVHPAVYLDLKKWMAEAGQLDAPFVIQESAILLEENLTARLSATILVVAPEEIRIQRVMTRDHVSREKVLSRMQHQWPDEQKVPLADFVIYNDGQRPLIRQVIDIADAIGRSSTQIR